MAQFQSGPEFKRYETLMHRAQQGEKLSDAEKQQLLQLAWGPRMHDLELRALTHHAPLKTLPEYQAIVMLPLRLYQSEFEELKRLAEHDARLPVAQRSITPDQVDRLEQLSSIMSRSGNLFQMGYGRPTERDVDDLEWIREMAADVVQTLRQGFRVPGKAKRKREREEQEEAPTASRARTPSRAVTPSRERAPTPVKKKKGTVHQRLQKALARRGPAASPYVRAPPRMLPPAGFG